VVNTMKNLSRSVPKAALVLGLLLGAPAAFAAEVTVYKSPTCGCCKAWIEHLEENGFEVEARDVRDVVPHKIEHGVSPQLASCHTALVDGYVIEGHVPAGDIRRLLAERPAVRGLSVPGMPVGSPGMEHGDRVDPYDVLSFGDDGKTEVYSSYR